jgi:hypothetical protein
MRAYKSFFDIPRKEVFKRFGETYLDDNHNLVSDPPTVLKGVTGDLQVYHSLGITQNELPLGYTLTGAYWFSTTYPLRTMNDATATKADIMEKDGRVWYVWKKEGGTEGPLSTDRYNNYVLLLEGLPNEGEVL